MKKRFDLDELMPEWQEMLSKSDRELAELDEEQEKIDKKRMEIQAVRAKYVRFIETANEMKGLVPETGNGRNGSEDITISAPPIRIDLSEMKLLDAVKTVLASEPNNYLSCEQVENKLLSGGFKSDSAHFRTSVGNILRKYAKDGKIEVDKSRFVHLYKYKDKIGNVSL